MSALQALESSLASLSSLHTTDDAGPSSFTSASPAAGKSGPRRAPFRFLDLPSEMRVRTYDILLHAPFEGRPIDLAQYNFRRVHPVLMATFLTCRQMHAEASNVFYGYNTISLFPASPRFFNTKLPLLARLPDRYRRLVTALEIRLGPGWSQPPSPG